MIYLTGKSVTALVELKARTTDRLKVDLDAYKPLKADSVPLPNGYAVFVASR